MLPIEETNYTISKFIQLGKPAARVGDTHECPKVRSDTGTPHVGGVINEPGNTTVLIGGLPAAVQGDACTCQGEPNTITGGSSGVLIGGKPAARAGDRCAHGGIIIGGCKTVLIGEGVLFVNYFQAPLIKDKEPVINQAILECVGMLERKLKLMLNNDPKTMDDFKEWFGCMDEQRMQIITNRIERALAISQSLTLNDFDVIADEFARSNLLAIANFWDEFHTIYLGELFGKLENSDSQTLADILVHEISHFWDVGYTIDFDYGKEPCLFLSENYSTRAFYNADNFMYFIKA